MTAKEYYKHFVSVSGAIVGLVGSFPLVSGIFGEKLAAHGFPPLGPFTIVGRFLCILFAAVLTFVVYFEKHSAFLKSNGARVRALRWNLAGALLFMLAYFCLHYRFVREIPVETKQTEILVTVGFERTEFAKKEFLGEDDWAMLRARGTHEEDINKLWTPNSILEARLGLFFAYLFALLLLVRTCSLGVLYEVSGDAANP